MISQPLTFPSNVFEFDSAINCQKSMKTETKAKKTQRKTDKTSEFFKELGLLTYQERSRFLPASENGQKEKSPIYIPSLSGNSQPFCISEY